LTLVSTPASPSANAYVNEATAGSYLTGERLYTTAWVGADVPRREAALMWATALLDRVADWNGLRRTVAQSLRWPRTGVYDEDGFALDYDTIPKQLERATSVFALYLLARDRLAEPDVLGLGLSAIGGKVSLTIDPSQVLALVPKEVIFLLGPLGTIRGSASGSGVRQVRLRRT